jgi:hypothetical protein
MNRTQKTSSTVGKESPVLNASLKSNKSLLELPGTVKEKFQHLEVRGA